MNDLKDNIILKIDNETEVLVVSDIHLGLPITQELRIIQDSLVRRINKLSESKKAVLVMNGDILELWDKNARDVKEIIEGFADLSRAIRKFSKSSRHQVYYTAGNHDENVGTVANDRIVAERLWNARICINIQLKLGKKTMQIEHGHEFDPYNSSDSKNLAGGKNVVENILPILDIHLPRVFGGISDIVDRSLLPTYIISNVFYKIMLPFALPLSLISVLAIAIIKSNAYYLLAYFIVIIGTWGLLLFAMFLFRMLAGLFLGGGEGYKKRLDKYYKANRFDVLILGHTHQGGVNKRSGYVYANSGCNDSITKPEKSWLVIPRFKKMVQMSDITILPKQKNYIKYNEELVSLLK